MRDLVGDPSFLLRKKIEAKFSKLYPNKWLPLYSQVTFSNIPYSVAYEQGKKQRVIMDEIMANPNIENSWDSTEVMQAILDQCNSFNFQT
jgi:kynurenine 3-monooxygenase